MTTTLRTQGRTHADEFSARLSRRSSRREGGKLRPTDAASGVGRGVFSLRGPAARDEAGSLNRRFAGSWWLTRPLGLWIGLSLAASLAGGGTPEAPAATNPPTGVEQPSGMVIVELSKNPPTRPAPAARRSWADPVRPMFRGIGYSPFRGTHGYADPPAKADRDRVRSDFAAITNAGFNAIRTWDAPPDWVLALAAENQLKVLAGLGAPVEGEFDKPAFIEPAVAAVRQAVTRLARHEIVIGYLVLNETRPDLVAAGPAAFAAYVAQLVRAARESDPARPVSYAAWIKSLDSRPMGDIDFAAVNLYGHDGRRMRANIGYPGLLDLMGGGSGLPLVVTEFGYSVSPEGPGGYGYGGNSLVEQADGLVGEWDLIAPRALGGFCFEFCDEGWKAGHPERKDPHAEEWFGLWATTPDDPVARPRPAVRAMTEAFHLTVVEPADMCREAAGRLRLLVNSWPAATVVEYRVNYGSWTPLPRVSGEWCSAELDTTGLAGQELYLEFRSAAPDGTRRQVGRHVWIYKVVPPDPLSVRLSVTNIVEAGKARVRVRLALEDPQGDGVPQYPVDVALEPLAGWETHKRHGVTDLRGVYETDFVADDCAPGAWRRAFGAAAYARGNYRKTFWAAVPFGKAAE